MRTPDYLSPTSIMLWKKDRMEFYRKYLGPKIPRMPQTEAMSVGSAFDAYIKNYLASCLGMPEADGDLSLDYLLEEQVEPHNRDFAFSAGRHCFEQYKELGATAELMKELETADKVAFESTLQATVGEKVPLLGKPDLYYWRGSDLIILDWKVNGYCSKRGASPRKGYARLLPGGKPHKDAQLIGGINVACCLSELDLSWATQLAIYGWVLGGLGKPIIAGIDQLACKPVDGAVGIRVAQLRSRLSEKFQDDLWQDCLEIWTRISEGRIFDENNDEIIAQLEMEAGAYNMDSTDPNECWFNKSIR